MYVTNYFKNEGRYMLLFFMLTFIIPINDVTLQIPFLDSLCVAILGAGIFMFTFVSLLLSIQHESNRLFWLTEFMTGISLLLYIITGFNLIPLIVSAACFVANFKLWKHFDSICG